LAPAVRIFFAAALSHRFAYRLGLRLEGGGLLWRAPGYLFECLGAALLGELRQECLYLPVEVFEIPDDDLLVALPDGLGVVGTLLKQQVPEAGHHDQGSVT